MPASPGGPGFNFMGEFSEFINIQNGVNPYPGIQNITDPTPRFIYTIRDLANYVHYCNIYQAYENACLILIGMSAKYDRGNPYLSGNQIGFGTFGIAHILELVAEVTTRAIKAVFYQKWFVHRRLRPEASGGLIEAVINNGALFPSMDSSEIINAMTSIAPPPPFPPGSFQRFVNDSNVASNPARAPGTYSYLLNQVFPEGYPLHPSYGAAHAAIAGACVTVLKAFFDESMPFATVYQPNAGATPPGFALTSVSGVTTNVGYELNKLAYNIAYARSLAGVHYRSDNDEGLALGEALAIQMLQEKKSTYNEDGFFNLTKFDGTAIQI